MRGVLFCALLTMFSAPLAAQADRLDAVALELEGIVRDLEAAQAQTAALRQRLSELETLTAEHQSALVEQEGLLGQYRDSVETLQAHDRRSLDLARELGTKLERERSLTAWLIPVAATAVAVAVAEGVVLGLRR